MSMFPSKIQPALLITKSPLCLGVIADRKVKPILFKNLMVVVLEDCERLPAAVGCSNLSQKRLRLSVCFNIPGHNVMVWELG
jgi:hypothetical protein